MISICQGLSLLTNFAAAADQQELFSVPGNGTPDQHILNNTLVGESLASDWGGAVLHEPGLQSSPLVGMPISCNDWILHHVLYRFVLV